MAKSDKKLFNYKPGKERFPIKKFGLLRSCMAILGALLVVSAFAGCSGSEGDPGSAPSSAVDGPAGTNETAPPEEVPPPGTEPDFAIEIAFPNPPDTVFPGTLVVMYPVVNHTGRPLLSFALKEAPPGMSIDFNDGTITWIPRKSDEGKTFEVTARVTDGGKFGQARFRVMVIKSEPFVTEIQGNVLTVTDPDTNLKGLSVTVLPEDSDSMGFPTIGKPPQETIPEIPSRIIPLSDLFLVSEPFYMPVEFRFPVPLDRLPGGVSSLNDVNLYAYIETLHGDKLWSPVAIDTSFEGTAENPVYVVNLAGMHGFAFFGYYQTNPPEPFAEG